MIYISKENRPQRICCSLCWWMPQRTDLVLFALLYILVVYQMNTSLVFHLTFYRPSCIYTLLLPISLPFQLLNCFETKAINRILTYPVDWPLWYVVVISSSSLCHENIDLLSNSIMKEGHSRAAWMKGFDLLSRRPVAYFLGVHLHLWFSGLHSHTTKLAVHLVLPRFPLQQGIANPFMDLDSPPAFVCNPMCQEGLVSVSIQSDSVDVASLSPRGIHSKRPRKRMLLDALVPSSCARCWHQEGESNFFWMST